MPAYFETGFSVREPMWHGEGIVLGEYPEDWADARVKAGLTWEPIEHPSWVLRELSDFTICRQCQANLGASHVEDCAVMVVTSHSIVQPQDTVPVGSLPVEGGKQVVVPDANHKQIIRNDTKAVLATGVSAGYATITHGRTEQGGASMEQITDAFKNADGSIRFETAGSVQGGKQVWALLYLDEPFTTPGDSTETIPFIAILNRHDGGGACKVIRTQVRVVCWNTYQMADAEAERTGLTYSFRHSGNVEERIEEAKVALAGLRQETAEYVAMATELSKLNVTDNHLSTYLSEFLPNPAENGAHVTDRVQANVDKARDMFRHIYLDSVTTEGVRGSAWGLVQASTEYLDHARAYRNPETYMGRSILRPEPLKLHAVNLARRVCNA